VWEYSCIDKREKKGACEMEYQRFIKKPCVDLMPGIRVTKETKVEYSHGNIEQTIINLELRTVARIKGDGFESVSDTTVYLNEGDVLIFEDEGRGYIKPLEECMSVADAIKELECIKDLE
jgi:hypothetical protein